MLQKVYDFMKTKTTHDEFTNFVLSSLSPIMLSYLFLPHLTYNPGICEGPRSITIEIIIILLVPVNIHTVGLLLLTIMSIVIALLNPIS